MNMRIQLILILATLLLFACKQGSTDDAKSISTPEKIENATSQADIEENTIIQYAKDKNLDCDRMDNGVYVCNLVEGHGAPIQARGDVKAHYKGYFFDGNEFDSSYKRKKPLEFKVGQMISGWNEWLVTVNEGTTATLLIPSAKAYGSAQRGPIPANTPLAFDVEVLLPTK